MKGKIPEISREELHSILKNKFNLKNIHFNKKKYITGAINIINLANYNSCSFIATDDIGKIINKDNFLVLGRIDFSDLRGCNLLI